MRANCRAAQVVLLIGIIAGLLGLLAFERRSRRDEEGSPTRLIQRRMDPVGHDAAPPAINPALARHARIVPVTENKDEIQERNGSYGYRGDTYLITAAPEGVTTSLPARMEDGRRPTLSVALGGVSVGGRLLAQGDPCAPRLRQPARTIVYSRGAVEEHYELKREGVEQSFIIGSLPEAKGDIVVRTSVRTNLTPPPDGTRGAELVFAGKGKESMSISKAVALDSSGRQLPLEMAYAQGEIAITVPSAWVAAATLPITIDPLVGGTIVIDPQDTFPTEVLDVSYCPVTNE